VVNRFDLVEEIIGGRYKLYIGFGAILNICNHLI
jgi:hypothetical protein